MTHDLSSVAPGRRRETLRRIAAIERFLEAPGRANAQKLAGELEIGVVQFYNLVKAWRLHGRPDRLPGAGVQAVLRTEASLEQRGIIAAAVAEMPDGLVQGVADRACEIARSRGSPMPSKGTIRKLVQMSRASRPSAASPARGADVVIANSAINLPVTLDGDRRVLPIATFVIEVETAVIAGVSLSFDDADASALPRALLAAIDRWKGVIASEPSISIRLTAGAPTAAIERILSTEGVNVRSASWSRSFIMNDAVAVLGRKVAGFALLPGLTTRPPAERRSTAPGAPVDIADAEAFLASRSLTTQAGSTGLDRGKAARISALLAVMTATGD